MRVLVAFDDEYRAYLSVITAGISILRPNIDLDVARPGELEKEIERFDPQVVICSQPNTVGPGDRLAWIELPIDPMQPAKAWIAGRCSESAHLSLEELVTVIDEVGDLSRKNADRTNRTGG